ncbi:MAG: DUF4838 domain-containing protein, partial [Lentisphaerota bacterium]
PNPTAEMTLFAGKMPPCVVAPTAPTAAETFAVKELRDYLQKITGQEIPVVAPDSKPTGPAIIVGSHPLNQDLGADKLGPEEYVIDVSKDFVRIAGGRKTVTDAKGNMFVQERGTLYGVYEFLETLGVRWYRPEEWGEHVPKLQTINLPTGIKTYRPSYKYRYGINGYRQWKDQTQEQSAMGKLWATRNRQNTSMYSGPEFGGYYSVEFQHSYFFRIPKLRYFATHPEYFALINGKRSNDINAQLCLSNPDVQRLFVESIVAQAKANPQFEVVSVEPNDSSSLWCQCDGCTALDDPKLLSPSGGVSMANRVCTFNNIIALKVAEQAPDVKIGWLAYDQHTEVPTRVTKLEPNTMVQATAYAGGYSDYSRNLDDPNSKQNSRFLKIIEGYGKLTQIMTHEYFSGYGWFGPMPIVHTMVDRLRAYRHLNVKGVYSQTDAHWGPLGLDLYMYTKLLWNPDLDVASELNLYCSNYYGPAATMMKTYHETLEAAATNGVYFGSGGSGLERLFNDELIAKLRPSIEQAQEAVRGKQPYERRLAGVVAGYEVACRTCEFNKLRIEMRFEEALRCLDELEKYVLSFKEGDVFDNGPNAYPQIAGLSNWKKWREELVEQTSVIKTKFVDAKIAQNHDKYWRFQTDAKDEGLAVNWMSPEVDTAAWPLLDADRWWQEQGYPKYYGVAWYRRQFESPMVGNSRRVILYFGAVDGDATVFVNGKKVGEHLLPENGDGWDKPFFFDITDLLQTGKPNLIAVRVKDTVGMSGIFKGVKLLDAAGMKK